MKIIPLASESLGVRSLAVYIKTKENNILIDPGVALGPRRYSLPPAKVEIKRLENTRKKILEFLAIADTIIISHYHYDHYIPEANYDRKYLFLKDPIRNINKSQKSRASKFLKDKKNYEYADGKTITEDFIMEFSPASPHGEKGTKLGFVIMTMIDHKKRIIHASDTQLLNKESVEWIIEKMPDLIITSGPPTYIGYMKDSWKTGRKNINQIITETDAEIILDHHIIRDKKYPRFFEELEKEPLTFAGYLGVEETPLEAYRKELHKIENGERISLPFNLE
ncbi:MAG: hypothetical protein QFX38_01240 [Methanothermobacter sp.]|nr:hypothetical protein [Methanothermobacter sp.]